MIIQLLTFFLLAFAFSFLANRLPLSSFKGLDIKTILCGMGPLLSGILCYRIFKQPNSQKITIGGNRPYLAYGVLLIAASLPYLFSHAAGKQVLSLSIFSNLVYCAGEEFGWRHFLQNSLSATRRWLRPFIIAAIWFAWHFSFIDNPLQTLSPVQGLHPLAAAAVIYLFLSILAFLWGDITEKSQSLLFAITAHAVLKFGDMVTVASVLTLILVLHFSWKKWWRRA